MRTETRRPHTASYPYGYRKQKGGLEYTTSEGAKRPSRTPNFGSSELGSTTYLPGNQILLNADPKI